MAEVKSNLHNESAQASPSFRGTERGEDLLSEAEQTRLHNVRVFLEDDELHYGTQPPTIRDRRFLLDLVDRFISRLSIRTSERAAGEGEEEARCTCGLDAAIDAEEASQRYSRHAPKCAAYPRDGEYCRSCDGCGWREGGSSLRTTCRDCRGTGFVREPRDPKCDLTNNCPAPNHKHDPRCNCLGR